MVIRETKFNTTFPNYKEKNETNEMRSNNWLYCHFEDLMQLCI